MAKYSVEVSKEKISRAWHILDILDTYAKGGELELEGEKFATRESRLALASEQGRKHVLNWFNDFGGHILDFRVMVTSYGLLELVQEHGIVTATQWASVADTGTQLVNSVEGVVSRLKDNGHFIQVRGSRFELSLENQAGLRKSLEATQQLVKRYCT